MSKLWVEDHLMDAELFSSKDATIAVVTLELNGEHMEWTGTAKRFPGQHGVKGDQYDIEIGAKLALSRALEAAARQLGRQAEGMVKSAADNREAARLAKLKPKSEGVFRLRRNKIKRPSKTSQV